MPCLNCNSQFTIFKRKKTCTSCQCFYCSNCFGKSRKNTCLKCQTVIDFSKSKNQLMQLKTKDLVFFLQSRKINIAGIVEKEELCNLIINHLNNNTYYDGSTASSASTPNDFDNYTQSFDQIKQTCQSLFNSITEKISSDLQKTTCFNQSGNNSQRKEQHDCVNPPQFSHTSANELQVNEQPSTSELPSNQRHFPKTHKTHSYNIDCECSDSEDYDDEKISEMRETILTQPPCHVNKKSKLSNMTSKESDSSFEEVFVGKSDDAWLLIQKLEEENTNSNSESNQPVNLMQQLPSTSSSSNAQTTTLRSHSDGDFNRISVDMSSNPHAGDIKVSCRKCGKAKLKIKKEILKLSEQLRSLNCTQEEKNLKIREFVKYLENLNKHESSEVSSHTSNDEIDENVLEESEGINVYASTSNAENKSLKSQNQEDEVRQFMSLDDIRSNEELELMSVKQLKETLMLNRVDFRGCCEKNELKERVKRLWESHKSAPPADKINSDDLCKICMDAPIECVFLECGHSIGCTACGKILSECPICRSYIVRVVRIFKS